MRQRLFGILIGVLLLPFVAHAAGGATFVLSPSASSVEVGARFSVDVLVNPNGEKLDTARVFIKFPTDLLNVEDIILKGLFPKQSPGNSVDTLTGMISQGGFILGGTVTESGVFAKITFTAKKEGNANIEVLNTSRLISNGEERANATGHQSATISINSGLTSSQTLKFSLSSSTHPNENDWYKDRKIIFIWNREGGMIKQWLTAFDQDPNTDPTEPFIDRTSNQKQFDEVQDGIWYFHLKAELSDGSFSDIKRVRVRIDGTPPNLIAPNTPRIRYQKGEDALLEFGTTDEMSGIDHYELSLNDGPFTQVTSPHILSNLEEGDLFIQVKAIDLAGNMRFGKTGIRVYEEDIELTPEDKTKQQEEGLKISQLQNKSEEEKSSPDRLLITSLLAVAVAVAIIGSVLRKRKRKV